MKTLFGMRIFPQRQHLTDDEFVDKVRNSLAKYDGIRKWLLGIQIFFAVVTILLIVWLLQMIVKMAPILNGAPGAPEIWFISGLIVGWSAGHFFSSTVHSLAGVLGDTMDIRTRRLLVAYYDAYATSCLHDVGEAPMDEDAGAG